MSYLGRKGAPAPINAGDIPDDSITTAKIVADAVGSSDLAPDIALTGGSVLIPSVTTANLPGTGGGTYAAQTATNGMLVYNSTLGMLQQYSDGSWKGIASSPSITSFTYSETGATAEDPAGGGVITITGSNFDSTAAGGSANVAVTFGGTTATSISVNSLKTIITCTTPAKAAGTVTMQVINGSGLTAGTNFIYDTIPVFTTASGTLGNFVDGDYIADGDAPIIAGTEDSVALTTGFQRVTSASDDTVITTTVAGLTLQTTGHLTGTLAGTNATTYPFYATAKDNENQRTVPRLFNIISYDYAASGGTTINTDDWISNYKIHVFTIADTATNFITNVSLSCDILVVAGGGGGGNNSQMGTSTAGGGGGAGGLVYATGVTLSGTYLITVGDGGDKGTAGSENTNCTGINGGNSIVGTVGITALGGGGGASSYSTVDARDGGSGGGGGYSRATGGSGTQGDSGGGTGYGNDGGNEAYANSKYVGGGGGGSGAAGGNGDSGGGGDGGAGRSYVTEFSTNVGGASGIFAGGGGGGIGENGTSGTRGPGGTGGGGLGGWHTTNGTDGTSHTGGGGGGPGKGGSAGGDGGSGIVIIRYAV